MYPRYNLIMYSSSLFITQFCNSQSRGLENGNDNVEVGGQVRTIWFYTVSTNVNITTFICHSLDISLNIGHVASVLV